MRPLILLFALLPALASAGVLFRCYDPATKKTTFQDSPCASAAQTKGAISYREMTPQELEQQRQEQLNKTRTLIAQQQHQQAVEARSVVSGPTVVESRPSRCAQMETDKAFWCNRNDSYGRQRCHDMIYNFNKSCR